MIYEGFKIHSTERISEAYCECNAELKEVSNGFLSRSLFCPKCENVYLLKKVKLPKKKLTEEFLKQCRFELKFDAESKKLRKKLEYDNK